MQRDITRQVFLSASSGAVSGLVLGGAVALTVCYCASFGDGQELLIGAIFVGACAVGMVVGATLGGRAVRRHFQRLRASREAD